VSWELRQYQGVYLLTPAFRDYYRALDTFNIPIYPCALNLKEGGFVYPSDLDTSRYGILFNNPHNPTGRLWERAQLLPYLENWGLVVVDEAFMDFLPPEQQQSLLGVIEDYPNLVILRSLTKFYSLPGLRIGYAIAHPERVSRWQKWRDPWPVNSLAVATTLAVIQDQEFQQLTWNWLSPARQQLREGLAAIPGLSPLEGSANFLLIETECPGSELQKQLLTQERILIRDCLSFRELGDNYFRVAVKREAENEKLIQAIAALY
jgi:histidinol-phosphate/aromatic aminotransferase/cobyric acid decarboxylase-like protein